MKADMTDKLGNTDRPDAPVVYRGAMQEVKERLEVVETRVDDLDKAIHILIDGLEKRLGVKEGPHDKFSEY